MARYLNREQTRSLLVDMKRLLSKLESGELSAPAATVYRLEGAIVALEAVLGEKPALLDSLSIDTK